MNLEMAPIKKKEKIKSRRQAYGKPDDFRALNQLCVFIKFVIAMT